MRLILCGGGDGEQVKESYELFANLVNGGKVLYIPLAWNNGNMETCINWLKKEMEPFGVIDIEDVLDAKEITKEKLSKYKGIFIGGGNTFKLLKMLKDTEAFNNLKEFLNNNGVIMGASAGALIFGKSIDTCLKDDLNIKTTDENLVELKDTTGFDMINGYSLFVHYQKKPEQLEQTKEKMKRLILAGHNVVALPEETSVYIDDDEVTVIGQKPAEIFTRNKNEIIEPNNGCNLNE